MYAGSALYKVTPEMFDTWLQVLRDAPASVLWLRDGPRAAADRLRAAAIAGAVDPARLVFAPAEPLPEYLARLALADLFLDTTPFGAHTTVNDALFMRVPVVTLAGRSFAARASASQVIAAGLPHLVAHDLASYRRIAAGLASEAPARAAALSKLGAVGQNALFDADAYATAFGEAVVSAWNDR
jgi:predicted O-linked N-acetylglucosamine transferase (SPINDLY family)